MEIQRTPIRSTALYRFHNPSPPMETARITTITSSACRLPCFQQQQHQQNPRTKQNSLTALFVVAFFLLSIFSTSCFPHDDQHSAGEGGRTFSRSFRWRMMMILPVHGRRILTYSVESITKNALLAYNCDSVNRTSPGEYVEPHWGCYDRTARTFGKRSTASDYDDNLVFDLVSEDFQSPFFQHENVSWFISSNGFLSPMPSAMCSYFCSGPSSADRLSGYYKMSTLLGSRGGDWPSAQVYVYDLNPPRCAAGRGIFKLVTNKKIQRDPNVPGNWQDPSTYNESRIALVEYYEVPQYSSRTTAPATVQGEIWSDGTIIFRYSEVFATYESMDGLYPTAGITWTKTQRVYLPTPLVRNTYVAHKLTPVVDPCETYNTAGCDACVAQNATALGACAWCGGLCVASNFATQLCVNPVQTECLDKELWNQFYNVTISQRNSNDDEGGGAASNASSSSVRSLPWQNVTFPISNTTTVHATVPSVTIDLPFPFPYFYNPPVLNESHPRVFRSVSLDLYGNLNFKSASQNCAQINGYCIYGDYSYVVVPLGAPVRWMSSSGGDNNTEGATLVEAAVFGNRTYGEAFCEAPWNATTAELGGGAAPSSPPPSSSSTTTSGGCEPVLVVHVQNMARAWSVLVPTQGPQLWEYYTLLHRNGSIETHYVRARPMPAPPASMDRTNASYWAPSNFIPIASYPVPDVGVMRDGVFDKGSAVVPSTVLAEGTTVRYTPLATCDDCYGGVCNRSTRSCACHAGYVGALCDACLPGYYGPLCTQCPTCNNGGRCIDGRDGSGACDCANSYSGQYCDVKCDRPFTCDCDSNGGYCHCGTCICNTSMGWSGTRCDQWNDTCAQWSLDGCPVCLAQTPIKCSYCQTGSENFCFADPKQNGIPSSDATTTPTWRTCSSSASAISNINATNCRFVTQSVASEAGVAVIVVILIFSGLGFAACFVMIVVCAFRRSRINLLVSNAVLGTPDFQFPRREREVVQMLVVPKPHAGKQVQGIPLKQVSLTELYEFQQQRKQWNAKKLRQQQQQPQLQQQPQQQPPVVGSSGSGGGGGRPPREERHEY